MSNHHENTRKLATAAFQTAWNNLYPIQWPGKEQPETSNTWARFTIADGEKTNAAIGGLLKRSPIIFGVQLRVPMNEGTKPAYAAGDAIAPALENKNFLSDDQKTTLKTRVISVKRIGEKNGFQIFTVTINAISDTE